MGITRDPNHVLRTNKLELIDYLVYESIGEDTQHKRESALKQVDPLGQSPLEN